MKIGQAYNLIEKAAENLVEERKRTDIYKFIEELL